MFAVKGWKVDAGQLKAQTELFRTAPDNALSKDKSDGKTSRKRKRDRAEQAAPELRTLNTNDDTAGTEKKLDKKAKKEAKRLKASEQQEAVQDDHEQLKDAPTQSLKPKKAKAEKQRNATAPQTTTAISTTLKLTPMQAAMRQKLVSARFRHLNETLYTAPSQEALDLFDSNPDMFEDYHAGFRQQVSVWPENPVDKMIEKIRRRGVVRLSSQKKAFSKAEKPADNTLPTADNPPLPRTSGTCVIADCGCGDARLAQTLKSANDLQKLNVKVLSYDLHSPSPLITKADISALPVADGSVDVVIFCLALMGTNWISFIEEAFRVLHWKGELWIAEIKSRFARAGGKKGRVVEHSVGNRQKRALQQKAQESKRKEQEEAAEVDILSTEVDGVEKVTQVTDVQSFVDVLKRRGFLLKDEQSIDLGNKMFVSMEFVKAAAPSKGKGHVETAAPAGKKKFIPKPAEDEMATEDEGKTLKPCLYKIR